MLLALALPAADAYGKLLGDESDGSRAGYIHIIDLLIADPLEDDKVLKIGPDDELLLPFSTRRTCGRCHSYDIISRGWHFDAAEAGVPPSRSGQPWILVDAGTATQIPLSYRPWPGAFRPEQIGLTPWQFTKHFGRHVPGGGPGGLESDNPQEIARQYLSGKLEINCLCCHNAHPGQNQTEYADQIARENFRWAAAASCEFAAVSGSAGDMLDTYDPFMPEPSEDPERIPPTVTYRRDIFDQDNRVFFDIARKVPTERCYFCHSNVNLDATTGQEWAADEDVHLAAGLTCVDCHRNGLDHSITRGYEGEREVSGNLLAGVSSCRGCHLEKDSSSVPVRGRLGAPVPKHAGIPPVHFDRLACTACHSGPWPRQKTCRTKTSRAHALGTHGARKSPDALPHIMSPVFARQGGKIAPHKLLWPAFWGLLKGQEVAPVDLEIARQTVGEVIAEIDIPRSGDWPSLTLQQIADVLKSLSSQQLTGGRPVYVCGGKLYLLDDEGNLVATEHDAARPYLWPLAHDVRPAAQSLGARGCGDCHATDAPFSFGEVTLDSPLASEPGAAKIMVDFQDVSPFYMKAFAVSFVFRPWLKIVALGSCAVLAAVLVLYGLRALACVLRLLAGEDADSIESV